MNRAIKSNILEKNRIHDKDTGSDAVQVAILQAEIKTLSKHLKSNLKDIVSRRILLKKVAKLKKFQKRLAVDKKKFQNN